LVTWGVAAPSIRLEGNRIEKTAALSGIARHENRPTMSRDDAEASRQSQPMPLFFGGEEGLEHAGTRDDVHARPGVLDLDEDPVSRPNRLAEGVSPALVGFADAAGTHLDEAGSAGEGVRRVRQQVHEHLGYGGSIAVDPGARLDGEFELCLLRQGRADERLQLAAQIPDVEHLGQTKIAFARVGQHLARQLGGAPARGRDGLHQLLIAGIGHARSQQVGVPEHADQQVVEVVGDSPGEHTQAVEALALGHELFQAPALVFQMPRLTEIPEAGNADGLPV
jgi:hypothetical protein